MKQYTTQHQTTKLIDLGFEKPCSIASVEPIYGMGGISVAKAYSIGELIEMLPLNRIEFDIRTYVDTTRGLFYDEELIDALFKACVKLKEEGVV